MKNTGKEKKFKYKRVKIYWLDITSNRMDESDAKDRVYFLEDTGYLFTKIKEVRLASRALMMMVHL